MEAAQRIARLCEGWQARVQDSTPEDQVQFAREFLRLLGWDDPASVDLPPGKIGIAYILRGASRTSLVAQFVMPGLLEPPGALADRGLDYCQTTRTIVSSIRQSSIRYSLITDLFRSYLYDVHTDELLLYADTPDIFNRDMAHELQPPAIDRDSLDGLRREPRSHIAREMREGCRYWASVMASTPGGSAELADMILDRMVLLRFLAEEDGASGVNWSLRAKVKQLFDEAVEGERPNLGTRLGRLFRELWQSWGAQIFQPLPQVIALLEQPGIAGPMLRDFALMSRNKFAIPAILESFNFGDPDEKARVRLVPEPDEERELYLARQTPATIESASLQIDLFEEGYRAIFCWFDRLVETCQRVGLPVAAAPEPEAHEGEMDLFAWSELNAKRPEAVRDPCQHVAENGLKVLYATPRQYRTARLLLYLHIVERYRNGQQRFARFPDIESGLVKRPAMSQRDKRRLFSG